MAQDKPIVRWSKEHPVAACVVVTILFVVLRKGLFLIFKALPQTTGMRWLHEILDVVWPFLMLAAFGRTYTLKEGNFFRTLLAGMSVVVISVALFAFNLIGILRDPDVEWYPPAMIILGLFTGIAIGFREETVFRGIAANVLGERYITDRKGIFTATALAAFFFGVLHMSNLITGASFFYCLGQSLNAFVLGALLVAIYLRGGNLWALIFLHAFYDIALSIGDLFTSTYGADMQNAMASNQDGTLISALQALIPAPIYIVATLILLRKSKCGEIIERFAVEEAEQQ